MDSGDLASLGFGSWHAFYPAAADELLKHAPREYGVYAIRRSTPYQRAHGSSDLLYVGSATNASGGLNMRLRQYFRVGHDQATNKRILALVTGSDQYQVAWRITATKGEALAGEADFLERYKREHGERPPQNRRG